MTGYCWGILAVPNSSPGLQVQASLYPQRGPKKMAQAQLGYFEGTPVDAYICSLGPDCGYTVAYPTKVPGQYRGIPARASPEFLRVVSKMLENGRFRS